jgi:hypothetical protein
MKKNKLFLFIFGIFACSCTIQTNPIVIEKTEPTTQTQIENITEPATKPVEKQDYLLDITNEKIYYSDASKILNRADLTIVKPEDASNCEKGVWLTFDNFTYGVFPRGIVVNSFTHEFDLDTFRFIDAPVLDEEFSQYVKISVGDTFGSLTVDTASVTLVTKDPMTEWYTNGVYLFEMSLGFKGEIEVTGYISSVVNKDIGYAEVGDVVFVMDEKQWDNIPFLLKQMTPTNDFTRCTYYDDKFAFSSDVPAFRLGSIFDDYNSVALSAIPTDGTYIHVKATLSQIEFYVHDTNLNYAKAKIVSVEPYN